MKNSIILVILLSGFVTIKCVIGQGEHPKEPPQPFPFSTGNNTTTQTTIHTTTTVTIPTTSNATTSAITTSTTPTNQTTTPPTNPTTTSSSTTQQTTTSTTVQPLTTTVKPIPTVKPTSEPNPDRRFDAPSFIGGFVLALGLGAIAFVSWKFYMSRQENYYHTL